MGGSIAKPIQKEISCYDVRDCLDNDIDMQDESKVRSALFKLGLDVNKKVKHQGEIYNGYYTFTCTHRTLANVVKGGYLYIGNERSDVSWIESGCATKEARLSSVK